MFEIVEAQRESAPITAAFIGGSGSGKTYSALLFARGLVGPDGTIVVIDSEGGRSKIYADDPDIGGFKHLEMVEPYTSERFREAFKASVAYGADAVVIDTISHEHEGFLEFADQEEARMSSSRAKSRNKWIKPKGARKRFYSAISSSRAHVVATIRLNRIVDMESKPPREIMKPECDKDLPYRLDLSVQIEADHTAKVIKVPKPLMGILEDGVSIQVRHGAALAQDIGQQAEPDTKKKDLVDALEAAADMGLDTFKTAYHTAWKANGEGAKDITPMRAHMQKHVDRLKVLAVAADELQSDAPEPGEIGDTDQPQNDDEQGGMFRSE